MIIICLHTDTAIPHFSLFRVAQISRSNLQNLYNLTKFVKTLWEGLTSGRKSGILYLALGETEC